jgi:hypothetical protein
MMAETTSLRDLESLPATPEPEMPLTVSPADTSLDSPAPVDEDIQEDEKRPAKKRKSWGQELPVPKTNLPPRYVPANALFQYTCEIIHLTFFPPFFQETSQDRR